MAKITALQKAEALTGAEFLPIVQGAETKRTTMAAFRDLITPFLQQYYKGDQGDTGPANNTHRTIASIAASDITNGSATLAPAEGSGLSAATYTWKNGDYSGRNDVIASDNVPISQGAWILPDARSLTFQRPEDGAVIRDVSDVLAGLGLRSSDFRIPTNGATDVTPLIQALINSGDCLIEAGTYRIKKITIPLGRQVLVDPRVIFDYDGPNDIGTCVFTLRSGASLRSSGGAQNPFLVRAPVDTPTVWATGFAAADNVSLVGIKAYRMSHVAIGGQLPYGQIVTSKMIAAGHPGPRNTSKNIYIAGGGASYEGEQPNTISAAAFLGFIERCEITDTYYSKCPHGIQFWGGDAHVTVDGAVGNERKALDYRIHNNVAVDCAGGGIWGSMGDDIRVEYCKVERNADVGFDFEGCVNSGWSDCNSEDNTNGQYVLFSYCAAITADNVTARTRDKSKPLIQTYNFGQDQKADDFSVVGGRFECLDPTGPGVITTNLGSMRHFSITAARLRNVKFAMLSGMGNVTISSNTMMFPFVAQDPFTVFDIYAVQQGYAQGKVVIANNRIDHEPFPAPQPAGTRLMTLTGIDPNLPPFFYVHGNTTYLPVQGGFAPIHLVAAGSAGTRFIVANNVTDGAIVKDARAFPGSFTTAENRNQLGVIAPETVA